MTRVMMKGAGVLVAAALAKATVIDFPVIIENTYSSVEMQIGTPPKTYRLLFDTGSASSWVVNSDCVDTSSCPNLSNYARVGYNSDESSTAEHLGPYSLIPYIDNDGVGGEAFQDVFATPDTASNRLSWNQTFLSANHSTWQFITADGFLGLAMSSIAETNTSTVFETLMQQGLLDEPKFGLYYGTNNSESGANPDGVLTFGGSKEETYVDGEVKYAPLRLEYPYQLWRTPLRSVIVTTGDSATNTSISVRRRQQSAEENVAPKDTTLPVTDGRIVFDTGAGRVSLPSGTTADVYTALGWNISKLYDGTERFSCADLNSTWAVSLVVGDGDPADDVVYTMRGNEFMTDQCMPPIDDSEVAGFALIGTAFLKRHYSVFDFGSFDVSSYAPRVGFGRLKKEYDPLYQ